MGKTSIKAEMLMNKALETEHEMTSEEQQQKLHTDDGSLSRPG